MNIKCSLSAGIIRNYQDIDKPNPETIEAMLEAERIDPNLKSYTVDEAFAGKGLPPLYKYNKKH